MTVLSVNAEALDSIRGICRQDHPDGTRSRSSYPHALAVYMALLDLLDANCIPISQRDIRDHAGCSITTVQRALGDLESALVLKRRRQTHGRGSGRIEDEYILIEPT